MKPESLYFLRHSAGSRSIAQAWLLLLKLGHASESWSQIHLSRPRGSSAGVARLRRFLLKRLEEDIPNLRRQALQLGYGFLAKLFLGSPDGFLFGDLILLRHGTSAGAPQERENSGRGGPVAVTGFRGSA
jgi:hypothetical protein